MSETQAIPQGDFYSNLQSGAPKPDLYGGQAAPAAGQVGAAPTQAPAKPAKQPMSRKRKMIWGGTAVLLLAAAAAVFTDDSSTKPKAGARRVPPRAAVEQPHAPAQAQPAPATVMGSGGPVVDSAPTVMGGTTPTSVPAGASTDAAPVVNMVPAPAAAPQAPVVAVAPTAVPMKDQANHAPVEAPVAQPDPKLEARIADLEEKIRKLEAGQARLAPVAEPSKPARVRHVKFTHKESTHAKVDEPKATLRETSRQAPDADHLQIVGVTARPSGPVALIEFAGVKQRYAVGDTVAGVGPIQSISIVNGEPQVVIHGVTYK